MNSFSEDLLRINPERGQSQREYNEDRLDRQACAVKQDKRFILHKNKRA